MPEPNVPTDPGSAIDAVSDPNGVKRTIIFKVFKIVKRLYLPNINDANLKCLRYYSIVMLHISMLRTIR